MEGRTGSDTLHAMPAAPRLDAAEFELDELEAHLEGMGAARFHARQIFQWVYRRGVNDFEAMTDPWAEVDLDEVRAALPDNLYWDVGAPTQDEGVIEARAAERARWNVEYGKVLSGNASEAEIRAYYDHRARLAADYVEFATYMLDHYGETLPEQDVGLLHLARRLNHARLEEIPRKIQEAFDRKRAQDAAREAWLADERAFNV